MGFDPFSRNSGGFSDNRGGRSREGAFFFFYKCSRKSIQSRFISDFVLTKLTLEHKSVTVLTSEGAASVRESSSLLQCHPLALSC